jgi:hypothetical protein
MIGILAIIIFLSGYFGYIKTGKQALVLVGAGLGPVIIIILMVSMYYLRPQALEISNDGITIVRSFAQRTLLFTDIESIRLADKSEMAGVIRTFGNGGLFGYTGLYYNKKLGSMTWYCTRRENYVIINMHANNRVVVTPDDPNTFIQDIGHLHPSLIAKPDEKK